MRRSLPGIAHFVARERGSLNRMRRPRLRKSRSRRSKRRFPGPERRSPPGMGRSREAKSCFRASMERSWREMERFRRRMRGLLVPEGRFVRTAPRSVSTRRRSSPGMPRSLSGKACFGRPMRRSGCPDRHSVEAKARSRDSMRCFGIGEGHFARRMRDFAQIIRHFVTTKWRISPSKSCFFREKRRSAPRKEPFRRRERRVDPAKRRSGRRESPLELGERGFVPRKSGFLRPSRELAIAKRRIARGERSLARPEGSFRLREGSIVLSKRRVLRKLARSRSLRANRTSSCARGLDLHERETGFLAVRRVTHSEFYIGEESFIPERKERRKESLHDGQQ